MVIGTSLSEAYVVLDVPRILSYSYVASLGVLLYNTNIFIGNTRLRFFLKENQTSEEEELWMQWDRLSDAFCLLFKFLKGNTNATM